MAGFRYKAVTGEGKVVRGVLESDSARQVRASLREQALLPVEVEFLSRPSVHRAGALRTFLHRGLSTTQLSLITRQLATLLSAGLTVEQTLNAIIEQAESHHERQILAGVRGEVMAGQSLGRAMAEFPNAFPDLYRTLVDAGEQSGQLSEVLLRLADYTEERQALRQKVALAFIYPAIISMVAMLVVFGLLTYVVPQIVQVFQNTNQVLPMLTRGLLALSGILQAVGVYLLLAAVLGIWSASRMLRIVSVRYEFDRMVLRLPLVGRLVRGLNTARLASTLAILVSSRVPLLSALEAGRGMVSSLPMKRALEDAHRMVREGGTLSRSLAASRMFPPLMVHLIASGEASGRLDGMLQRVAIQQTREIEGRITALIALLEPLLILAMGAIVLAIVLAILLPIFELNQLVK